MMGGPPHSLTAYHAHILIGEARVHNFILRRSHPTTHSLHTMTSTTPIPAASPIKAYVPPMFRVANEACAALPEHIRTIEQAEQFARTIKERLRQGELTDVERRQCIELALRFADPQRVAAVRRAVDHSQTRRLTASARSAASTASASTACNLPSDPFHQLPLPTRQPTSPQLVVRTRVAKPSPRSCRSYALACSPALVAIVE